MMSFIGAGLPRLGFRQYPKAQATVLAPGAWAAPVPAHDGQGSMESATLTRLAPGPIRLARLRAVRPATWAKIGFAAMCVGRADRLLRVPDLPDLRLLLRAAVGRDLLHLHLPDFRVYRGPTEHPLAIAFGMLCSIFGQGGARLMVLGSIASFVALVAGIYRLGRLCFGPVVGLVAALLVLSRFFVENLAAQGYLDISYVALIVWAIVLEVERPRRGAPVLLTLAAAGLLRPDAWVLSGVYWLWCSWRADNRHSAGAEVPGAGRDRAGRVGRDGRDRDRQPAVLADLHRRAGPGTGTHAGALERDRLGVDVRRAHRQAAGGPRRARRRAAGDLADAAARARAAGGAGAAARRVRARGRRRRVGDRPLPAGRRDRAAAVLRRRARRLGDARAGLGAAPRVDGRRGGARAVRRDLGGHHAQPHEPAHDARLPRGLPQGPRGRAAQPGGQGASCGAARCCRCRTTS